MANVLERECLLQGVSFTDVARRMKFIGFSLSMFSNKMSLIEPLTQINRSFAAAVRYTSEFEYGSSNPNPQIESCWFQFRRAKGT